MILIEILIALSLLLISFCSVQLVRKASIACETIDKEAQKLDDVRLAEVVDLIPAHPDMIGFKIIPETREISTVRLIGWRIVKEKRPRYTSGGRDDTGFHWQEPIFDQQYLFCYYYSRYGEIIGVSGRSRGNIDNFAESAWITELEFDSSDQLKELLRGWAEQHGLPV